jgi:hypothetical protein
MNGDLAQSPEFSRGGAVNSMLEFYPISTIQKDGEIVLFWSADHGYFVGNKPGNNFAGVWHRIDDKWFGSCEREAMKATHWARLPIEPKLLEQ